MNLRKIQLKICVKSLVHERTFSPRIFTLLEFQLPDSILQKQLSPFQITTPPDVRFRALLSDGAQEVRLTRHLT
jgi:hypothetical protein